MYRYKLKIEYQGGPFSGWQRQKGLLTVQGVLETVLYDFIGCYIEVFGSGRTDAGVHARGQVAHVDLPKNYAPFAVQGALNSRLRDYPIIVVDAERVRQDFHARFSTTSRSYTYIILNRPTPAALDKGLVWWVAKKLDPQLMHEGAQHLIGHHDFTSYRDSMCQAKSPMKSLDKLDVIQEGDYIFIHAKAPSFLHHQVRNIVGTLRRVGDKSWQPYKMKEILLAKNRCAAGPTAPPDGLYLTDITYI